MDFENSIIGKNFEQLFPNIIMKNISDYCGDKAEKWWFLDDYTWEENKDKILEREKKKTGFFVFDFTEFSMERLYWELIHKIDDKYIKIFSNLITKGRDINNDIFKLKDLFRKENESRAEIRGNMFNLSNFIIIS